MPEFHPDTTIEIPDNVPTSGFRNAIPNSKRYMRHNAVALQDVADAAYTGDYVLLEEMLSTGNERRLFNGDLNAFVDDKNPLHFAAQSGNTECVELLLRAGADPHVKESMPYGKDPEEGRTALQLAQEWGWDDMVPILQKAEGATPYGWYMPAGKGNNAKVYGCWGFGKKPPKGWFMGRRGVAELWGLDPAKYGLQPFASDVVEQPEASGTYVDVPKPAFAQAATQLARAAPAAPVAPAAAPAPAAALPPFPAAAEGTLPIGLLFPGQGSQYVNMMRSVKDIPAVREMLQKAEPILGFDVLDLCLNGPDAKLEETRYCQPAMFVAGMAGLEKLKLDKPEVVEKFRVSAGLSLGEYSALCAAGVFSFEDGLRLVKLRGEAMQEAAAVSAQGMASVAGLDKDTITKLCQESAAAEGPGGVCMIANELFPKGFSCAGTRKAIETLQEKALAAGALQAKMLKTSGGFHTSLMQPAKERLGKALDELLPSMKPPAHCVWMNTTAQPLEPGTDPKEVVELLKRQLTTTVLWETSVRNMIRSGITEFYEVGPQKQIKAMMKRIDPTVWGSTTSLEI